LTHWWATWLSDLRSTAGLLDDAVLGLSPALTQLVVVGGDTDVGGEAVRRRFDDLIGVVADDSCGSGRP